MTAPTSPTSLPRPDLVRRLTLPKYLLREAQRTLQRTEPYSHALAVSLLQDATETFLRVLVEHGRINVNDRASFEKLLEEVTKKFPTVGEHRAALSRVNRARIAFKHHGLKFPDLEDASTFLANVREFLVEISREILDVDFESVSLSDTITHRRTKNWLRNAEQALTAGDYREALRCARTAFLIFITHRERRSQMFGRSGGRISYSRLQSPFGPQGFEGNHHLANFVDAVQQNIVTIGERLDLLANGINLPAYDRFMLLTPNVILTINGKDHCTWSGRLSANSDDARFCIDFAIDAILTLANGMPAMYPSDPESPAARVVHECKILVWPETDSTEPIRTAKPGEVLQISSVNVEGESGGRKFLPVLQDGDVAYVDSEYVEINGDIERKS